MAKIWIDEPTIGKHRASSYYQMKTSLNTIKKVPHFCGTCSPSWARTRDPLINSQML
jgi:hypothetical protein